MPRILLKLSGEALATPETVLDKWPVFEALVSHPSLDLMPSLSWTTPRMLLKLALDVKEAREFGVGLAVVIGGGNICRGKSTHPGQRPCFDKIGMLATTMNGLVLRMAFEAVGVPSLVLSSRSMPAVCDVYTAESAQKALEEGKVVVCTGGSGLPFFSTDTAAVIRACELGCQLLLKATKVNGAYAEDPLKNPHAEFISQLSYEDVLQRKLGIMDATAVALAQSQNLPLDIFNTYEPRMIQRVLQGELLHTRVG